MTTVAVVGGTGTAGRRVVAEAVRRGHAVRSLSRHLPTGSRVLDGVDYRQGNTVSGEGLAAALADSEVLVDCANGMVGRNAGALTAGASRLADAARTAGVRRIVVLSIVNIERSTSRYYLIKLSQEQRYLRAGLDVVVVRASQFHDLVGGLFAASARVGIVPAPPGVHLQPVDTRDVARALLDAADPAVAPGSIREIVGPEVRSVRELAEAWKRHTRSRARLVAVPLPGAMGAFMRAGHAVVPDAPCGRITFQDWLRDPG